MMSARASTAPCVQVVFVLDAVSLDASQQMSGVGVRFGQSKVEITIGLRTSNFVAVATST